MGRLKRSIGWIVVAVCLIGIPYVWATTVSDQMWFTKGAALGNDEYSVLRTDTVVLTNAQIKDLHDTPVDLVAAPGSDKFLEFVSAVLILDYGSNALVEDADNLVIQYDGGTDATGTIECTNFIDAEADTVAVILPTTIAYVASANVVNDALELYNPNDDFTGNDGADTVMYVHITYRVHKLGL